MISRPWPLNDVIFVVFHREIYFFLFVRVCFCNTAMAFFLFFFFEKMNYHLLQINFKSNHLRNFLMMNKENK
jgi:hypothetical protein